MAIQFTKIKYDGKKVTINYVVPRADKRDPDEYTLLCVDGPRPEFADALRALREDVVGVCELDAAQAEKIDVRGVTLTWTNDIMGACITGLKKLKGANAPLVLNTPHLPMEPYSDNPDEPVMSTGMACRLEILIAEAERYVNGERAQASLFESDAAPVEEPVNAGV